MQVPGELIPITLFIMVPIAVIGAPIARAIARRIERGVGASLPNDAAARLERMEQAIDAIAIEVERIAEGQRFTSRLLAERSDAARPNGSAVPTHRQDVNRVG